MVGLVCETEWVLLAYRLPREPSTPRIAVWRKLRRLGAVPLVDGLVALPADPTTIEAFDWVAEAVLEAGGEAWTWRAKPGSKGQNAELVERINDAVGEQYHALMADVEAARSEPSWRTADRLRRELHRIQARDHFGAKDAERARRAVERFATVSDDAEAPR